MLECFGPVIPYDKLERGDRLLEEVLELLQSGDYPTQRISALTDYVYGRDKGEPAQEAGGVMVTLAAYCLAHDLDMGTAGEAELARIWTKVEKIRAKQAAKPTGSALPIVAPETTADPEPIGWWYQDSTGCIHMSLDMNLGQRHERETGCTLNLMYGKPLPTEPFDPSASAPTPQPHLRWLPIERADKSVDRIYDLPGMPRPIANSEEYWCRDADGRVFLATWADDGKRAYWWDLDGESPVDPVEFMPHPLDTRFATTEGRS